MKPEKLKVMIVDDSKLVLERVRFLLERSGHLVSVRDSPLGTVAAVMKDRPDVLILDVSMPALDGGRLASLVTELKRNIIVIFHSSRDEGELHQLTRQTGAHGFIPKMNDFVRFMNEFNHIVSCVDSARSSEVGVDPFGPRPPRPGTR